MKQSVFVLGAIFLITGCASSGHFVDSGLFAESPFSVGEGSSPSAASAAAERAIPPGFEEDKAWSSRGSGCAKHGEVAKWDRGQESYGNCASGRYQVEIPLLSLDPAERAAILSWRKFKTSKAIAGHGETEQEAKANLLKRLPSNAVVDTWTIGCTKKVSYLPDSGAAFCDKSISGNQREVRAMVREPNVNFLKDSSEL